MLDFLSTLFRSLSPLWEMSVTAAYAAAIVIVLRLLLKKRAPKQVLCLLWLVVFARLLIPISLESPLSIIPDALPRQEQQIQPAPSTPGTGSAVNPITPQTPAQSGTQSQPADGTVIPAVNNPSISPVLTVPEDVTPSAPQPEASAPFPWQAVLGGVWLAGAAALAFYALCSYFRLRRCLFDAIRARDGAWEHPAVNSPFILGVLRPRIYLPAGLSGQPRQFILCHERAHLRRLDHVVKPVCWVALALHWFNPMVWAAYILMSRDIEAACDEAVIRRLGPKVKADYSATLLALATNGRVPAPCPLAFDEGNAKGRIKNVLGYRRPALWVIVVSAIAAVLAAVCLLTDPVAAQNPEGDLQQGPGASHSPENSPGITQAPVNLADTLLDPWMKEVLDGERQFISAYSQYAEGDGRTYSIHDLRTFYYGDDQFPDAVVEAGRLAVIDLDRDGVNEMVIWPEGEYEYLYSVVGFVILHRQGDEIYGYNPVYRAFGNLKSDGTFSWSDGAPWNGFATLTFEPGEVVLHETTYHKPAENGIDQLYFVDGQKATREEYGAAEGWEFLKPEAAWFTYEDGKLAPFLPAGAELLAEASPDTEAGAARLWQGEHDRPYLEWNGASYLLGSTVSADQSPALFVRDFDGDGQNELVFQWMNAGFARYEVYEWNNGALAFVDAFDTQDDILLRFNQYNVAAYNPDSRGLTVTYSHTEGDPDSEDYYRHFVTGSCTLPEDFFNGYEHIRDGYTYAYAYTLSIYFSPDNSIHLEPMFCLADETTKDLVRVDVPGWSESEMTPYQIDHHYMEGRFVGTAAFTLRYDGAKWVLREPDQLNLDYYPADEPAPIDITTAAPLSAPIVGMNDIPEDPDEWYKVAELPDDMIWVFSRNYGAETLIRWDGNFYKVFDHTAHTPRRILPQLKKLGSDDNFYGPLAIITNVGSGTGVSVDQLVVYDLDAAPVAVDYTHDWTPLRDGFNSSRTFQYDGDAHTITTTYEGQTAELIIDGSDEMFRRIDEEGVRLAVTGDLVYYRFNEDGTFQLEFPLQAFIGDDVVNAPMIWPWFLRWTIRFNGAGFDTIPGSCELFTYAGQ